MSSGGDSLPITAGLSQEGYPEASNARERSEKPKRVLIKSACDACRRRKSKCDGRRPQSSRCEALHTECRYEFEQDESRWAALKRRIETLENERNDLKHLLALLRSYPEEPARRILSRICTTSEEELPALAQEYRARGTSAATGAASSSAAQQLPSIHSVFADMDLFHPSPASTRSSQEGDISG